MKRNQHIEREGIGLFLPCEIWYTIFELLGQEWYIRTAASVSHEWARIVRENTSSFTQLYTKPRTILSDVMLERVPNLCSLHTQAQCFYVSARGFEKLTRLNKLHLDVSLRMEESRWALTSLTNLIDLHCTSNFMLPCASTNLTNLSLSDNRLVDEKDLLRYQQLSSLSIVRCPSISARCISNMTNLVDLHISISGDQDGTFLNLTNLTKLRVSHPSFVGTTGLSKLTKLVELDLLYTINPLGGDSFDCFPLLTRLFVLPGTRGASVMTLSTSLRSLTLGYHTARWIDMATLPALHRLEVIGHLDLTREMLTRLPSLTELNVNSLTISRSLRYSELTRLSQIRVDHSNFGPVSEHFPLDFFYGL